MSMSRENFGSSFIKKKYPSPSQRQPKLTMQGVINKIIIVNYIDIVYCISFDEAIFKVGSEAFSK